MNIDIYEGKGNKFISVPTGKNPNELKIENLDNNLNTISIFKKNVEIQKDKNKIGLPVNDIISQINTLGYALHDGATNTFTESVVPDFADFYKSLQDSYDDYCKKWGTSPNFLFMNAKKHSELYKWSSINHLVIEFKNNKQYLFQAEIIDIVDFHDDFIWLEKADIIEALNNKTDYVKKIINNNFEVVDGITPEIQTARINIPNEVLAIRNIFR